MARGGGGGRHKCILGKLCLSLLYVPSFVSLVSCTISCLFWHVKFNIAVCKVSLQKEHRRPRPPGASTCPSVQTSTCGGSRIDHALYTSVTFMSGGR